MIVRDYARRHDIPKHIRNLSSFPDEAFRQAVSEQFRPADFPPLSINVAEWLWRKNGSRMYFPQSVKLLKMLWAAQIDITMTDLGLSSIPQAIAFAMPCESTDSRQKGGSLLLHGKASELIRLCRKFHDGFYHPALQPIDCKVLEHLADEHVFLLTFSQQNGPGRTTHTQSMFPTSMLDVCLRSPNEFHRLMSEYVQTEIQLHKEASPELVPSLRNCEEASLTNVSQSEWQDLHLNLTLVVRLLAYMRACPEQVRDGFPEGESAREYSSQWFRPTPVRILSPKGLDESDERDERNGPRPHYRSCYFRRYPTRSDGSRQKGILFIPGTFVNAHIDPHTIKDGGNLAEGTKRQVAA